MIEVESEDCGKIRIVIPMTEIALYGVTMFLVVWLGVTLGVVSARMISW